MASVRAKPNERVDSLIRRFQKAVEQAGIMKELKKREYFMSKAEKRKVKRKAAEKRRRKEAQHSS